MPLLGSSKLDVFPLVLGGNTFGWTSSGEDSMHVLDAFVAGGGNTIDTADTYSSWIPGNSGGESETIIGDWLAKRNNRDAIIIATKVGMHPHYPNLKAPTIHAAIEQSLKRLRTDYIDIYYAHIDDPDTPIEETVDAFSELVERGLIRYIALSNYSADRIKEWFDIAEKTDSPLPIALQPEYNLLVRKDFEENLLPIAQHYNLGVLPYRGIANGFLTGKYHTAEDAEHSARANSLGAYLNDAGFAVVYELETIANELDVEPATVALAWLRAQPTIVAPIASARTTEQLPPLLASATLMLSDDQLTRLGNVSDAFEG